MQSIHARLSANHFLVLAIGIRLACQLFTRAGSDPETLGQFLVEDARRFSASCPQHDDVCLICFSRGASGVDSRNREARRVRDVSQS